MKKFFIFILILLIALTGIFYKSILGTWNFYTYQSDNAKTLSRAKINWEEISFSSNKYINVSDVPLTLQSLVIPFPFEAFGLEQEENFSRIYSNGGESVSVSTVNNPEDFLTSHDFTEDERKSVCQYLSTSAGLGACTSNYNLKLAFFSLEEADIGLFSSLEEKTIYLRLIEIRADSLISKTVSPFETKRIRGFLYTLNEANYVAEVYDSRDQMYRINFKNLPESDVAFILSNISEAK